MDKQLLTALYKDKFGENPEISPVAAGGSPRRYYRLTSPGRSIIGVVGNDESENKVFLRLAKFLGEAGIRVPEVIHVNENSSAYLLSDLGDVSLFGLLSDADRIDLAKAALRDLIQIQLLPEDEWKDRVGFSDFSERLINWDLNYFKYDFLKPMGVTFDEEALEDDFDLLRQRLTSPGLIQGLMYRDFQSRNIMVSGGELWFIDFQGARKGPACYDAASFIRQAKAPFTYEERDKLSEFYSRILSEKTGRSKEDIGRQLDLMTVFRQLQVLGAYGFRGLIERKPHFLESIPHALAHFNHLSEKGLLDDYPEIKKIAESLYKDHEKKTKEKPEGLTVSVFSFSYKKGYPSDNSGNGGGFMFDCRGMHNPGRYPQYKSRTGLDSEVAEFLEEKGEVQGFVDRAMEIVSPSVERYLDRGFTSLQVGFGCTGGQHRSVYCAQKFAEEIRKRFPAAKVSLEHREQNIKKEL